MSEEAEKTSLEFQIVNDALQLCKLYRKQTGIKPTVLNNVQNDL